MNVAQLKRFCRSFPGTVETQYGDPYNFLVYSVGGRKFAYFKTSAPERWRFSTRVTPERFVADRLVFDTVDDPEVKVARMYVTRCEGRVSVYEMDYLVASRDGVAHFTEEERLGLFTRDEYLSAFRRAGLTILDCESDLFGYGLFVGVRAR